MANDIRPGIAPHGVMRAAPFDSRAPSPPLIHIPVLRSDGKAELSIVPTFENVDSSQLTNADLGIITQGRTQMARDSVHVWRYESRREAQAVLDFLYLGPSSAIRDRAFLQREGITMLLAVRDARLAEAKLMSAERIGQELGLQVDYIDVSNRQELIRAFPHAVRKINDHLIQRYRSQAVQVAADQAQNQDSAVPQSRMVIDSAKFSSGKVLVFCETGNDRSAAIVAAYLMTMFNSDLVKTLQFVTIQRFCANFDEETKYLLKSYEDIITARRTVNSSMDQAGQFAIPIRSSAKRNISDALSDDGSSADLVQGGFQLDRDRYTDRDPFAPFVDGDVPMAER
jgi:hypothetical protein